MRIGKVVGTIWLSPIYETLKGGRFLIIATQDRFSLAGGERKTSEHLICYDHLGAGQGDLIAFSESREAVMPFYPEKRVPLDAYCSAILDHVVVEEQFEWGRFIPGMKVSWRINMAYGANGNGSSSPRVSEWQLKDQMCDIGRRIWQKGFCAGNEGNHSYRISENRILCTPTGISKGNLKPDDICTVDLEGKQTAGKRKRTSEILLHLEIYKARPDVKAVIHSHPPHATAFAIAGVELPTCIHPEAEIFLGVVKTAKYVTPGDKRLGQSILPYVKDPTRSCLKTTASVTFAATLEEAYYKLEIVDAYARILILAKQIGQIRPLDGPEMKELLELKVRFGLEEPRLKDGGKGMTCASDFLSRVGGEVATKGRMAISGGTIPVPTTGAASPLPSSSELRPSTAVQASPMQQAIHSWCRLRRADE